MEPVISLLLLSTQGNRYDRHLTHFWRTTSTSRTSVIYALIRYQWEGQRMERGRQRPSARHTLHKRNNRSKTIRVGIISAIGTLPTSFMT